MSQSSTAPAVHASSVFAQLAEGGPGTLALVTLGFEEIITSSFMPGMNPVRDGVPTQGHVKERFAILEKRFRELRGDKQWGVQRILDALPGALRAELNGSKWEPGERSCWIPGDD